MLSEEANDNPMCFVVRESSAIVSGFASVYCTLFGGAGNFIRSFIPRPVEGE